MSEYSEYSDYLFIVSELFLVSLLIISLPIFTLKENFSLKKVKTNYYQIVGYFFLFSFSLYFLLNIIIFTAETFAFNYTLSISTFSWILKLFLIIIFLICLLMAVLEHNINQDIKSKQNINPKSLPTQEPFEFFYVLGFHFIGIIILLLSNDLLIMFLGLELQSFSLYILIGLQRTKIISVETSIKYYILGGLSSCFILFGSSIIYGFTGLINFSDIATLLNNSFDLNYPIVIGIILMLIGFLIKLGVAPFHVWVPEIYNGVSNIVLLILLTLPKIGLILFLIKYIFCFFFIFNTIIYSLLIMSVFFSIVLGTMAALNQVYLKKFIAGSAIVNTGYLIIGFLKISEESLFCTILYLIVYVIQIILVFSTVMILKDKNNQTITTFNDLKPLLATYRVFTYVLALNLFSMAGLPPLLGFFAKFYILNYLIDINAFYILIVVVLLSCITAFYYIKILHFLGSHDFEKEEMANRKREEENIIKLYSSREAYFAPIKKKGSYRNNKNTENTTQTESNINTENITKTENIENTSTTESNINTENKPQFFVKLNYVILLIIIGFSILNLLFFVVPWIFIDILQSEIMMLIYNYFIYLKTEIMNINFSTLFNRTEISLEIESVSSNISPTIVEIEMKTNIDTIPVDNVKINSDSNSTWYQTIKKKWNNIW